MERDERLTAVRTQGKIDAVKLGLHLVQDIRPTVHLMLEVETEMQVRAEFLQVVTALAAYRADGGRYPKSLDELAPQFMAKAPLDPYDGSRLRFRPTDDGYVLYAVGPDGRDDGGQPRDREALDRPYDIVLRMPPNDGP